MRTSKICWTGLAAMFVASGCSLANESAAPVAGVARSAIGGACTTISATSSPASQANQGDEVDLSWTVDGCSTPEFQVWDYPPGGPWSVLQDWSTSSSLAWDTSSFARGRHFLQVWGRNQGSSEAFEAWTGIPYDLLPIPTACRDVTVGFSPAYVTATSDCGGVADYSFYTQAPGSGAWTLAQDWSPSSQLATGGLADATLVQAWVRNHGSVADYEAWDQSIFFVNPHCDSVTASLAGSPLAFSMAADCRGLPEYSVWMGPPSGPWMKLSDWGPSDTLNWDTTALAAGSYSFQVWVRAQGSSATYDAWTPLQYNYEFAPCSGTAVSASPDTTTPGNSVTLTGSTTACATPSYRFYMLPPGGSSFQLMQDWSTSTTFAWDTTSATPGDYLFQVWTRDADSTSDYDDIASLTYSLRGAWDACPGQLTPIDPGTPVDVSGMQATTLGDHDDYLTCDGIIYRSPTGGEDQNGNDRVYKVVPSANGTMFVQLRNVGENGGFDGMLSAWENTCTPAPASANFDTSTGLDPAARPYLGCSDHADGQTAWDPATPNDPNTQESLTFTVTAGTPYYVVVDGYQGTSAGQFWLHVELN